MRVLVDPWANFVKHISFEIIYRKKTMQQLKQSTINGITITVLTCLCLARRAVATSQGTNTNTRDLSSMLRDFVLENNLVGVAAFSASSTSVCAAGAAGNLSAAMPMAQVPRPVDLWSSPWHGGSLTKSMTATLAALLVKDESIDLEWETTLGDTFLEARNTPFEDVTLEDLASHRGGFRRAVIQGPEDMNAEEFKGEGSSLLEQRRSVALFGFTTDPVVHPGRDFNTVTLGIPF